MNFKFVSWKYEIKYTYIYNVTLEHIKEYNTE